MHYNSDFLHYNVPENIANIVTAICKRFTINGECDGMYIANTIACACGIGDGCGNFTDNKITNSLYIAEQLQGSYGCNILKSEISELQNIIDTGNINKQTAIDGISKFISRLKAESLKCDEWRIDYLAKTVAKLAIPALVIQSLFPESV